MLFTSNDIALSNIYRASIYQNQTVHCRASTNCIQPHNYMITIPKSSPPPPKPNPLKGHGTSTNLS